MTAWAIAQIDCPEKGQAYGQKAKQAASAFAFAKEVTLQTHGHDKYKRIIGEVFRPMGRISIRNSSRKAGAGGIAICAGENHAGMVRN